MPTYNLHIDSHETIDLEYYIRETVDLTFNMFSDSSKQTPQDLTDYNFYCEVRERFGGTILIPLTPVVNSTNITINIPVPDTLKPKEAKWDLLRISPTNKRKYIAGGVFQIKESVTDDEDPVEAQLTGFNVQTAVTQSYTRGPVYLPQGVTSVTSPIITENKSSLTIIGRGRSMVLENPTLRGARSVLRWDSSNESQSMFDIRGSEGYFANFALHGDLENNPTGRKPQTAFLVSFDAGLGAGSHVFERLSIDGFGSAFQAGEIAADTNCDVCAINHCIISTDRVLLVEGHQALGWSSYNSTFRPKTVGLVAYEYQTSGVLDVLLQKITHNRVTVLRLDQQQAILSIGRNNGLFSFTHMYIDAASTGTTLLDVPSAPNSNEVLADVVFDKLIMQTDGEGYQQKGTSLAILRGGTSLNCTNGRLQVNVAGSLEYHTAGSIFPSVANFENMTLSGLDLATDILKSGNDGTITLRMIGCKNHNNVRIPDFEEVV